MFFSAPTATPSSPSSQPSVSPEPGPTALIAIASSVLASYPNDSSAFISELFYTLGKPHNPNNSSVQAGRCGAHGDCVFVGGISVLRLLEQSCFCEW
jgi:hypothetical protein